MAVRDGRLRITRWATLVASGIAVTAASGATRALPGSFTPMTAFDVVISLEAPVGTSVAALEDAPPIGWTVANISDGGSFDVPTGKVKWGLFFAPSIPAAVSYDVTAPAATPSAACFLGTASFDGLDQPIGGETCIAVQIPVLNTWGLVVLCGLLASAGSALVRSGGVDCRGMKSSRRDVKSPRPRSVLRRAG